GPRDPAHRHARAPVQPTLPPPAAGVVAHVDRRGLPASLDRAPGRAGPPGFRRALRLARGRRGRDGRSARRAAAAAVPDTDLAAATDLTVRPEGHGALLRTVHRRGPAGGVRAHRRRGRGGARRGLPRSRGPAAGAEGATLRAGTARVGRAAAWPA